MKYTKYEVAGDPKLDAYEKEYKRKKEKERKAMISKYGRYKKRLDESTFLYDDFIIKDGNRFDISDIDKVSYANYCNSDTGGEDYYVQLHMKSNSIPVVIFYAGTLDDAVSWCQYFEEINILR